MQRNINYSQTFGISVALSSIATSSPFAKTKILHDSQLNPFAYAIGYGCNYNSSLIVGGTDEDEISSYIIIKFAQDIKNAYETGKTFMGMDIAKILLNKGIWLIPNYKACKNDNKAQDLIINKISPKRVLELSRYENGIKYNFGKKAESNAKLLPFLLSASSLMDTKQYDDLPQGSVSNWFSKAMIKPAINIGLGKLDEVPMISDIDILYQKLIDLFMLFIIA